METFTSITGWILIAAVAVGLVAIACCVVIGLLLRLLDRMKERGASEERVRLHRNLLSGAHWFSEHPPTSQLMQEYANRVAQWGETNVSDIRDQWRKEMQKQTVKSA